jgi:hypothetical protein
VPKDAARSKEGVAPTSKKRHKRAMRKRLLALFAVLFASAALFAPEARADEPEPLHRYTDDRRPPGSVRTKLFLTGAAVTGAFYVPVLGASYIWDEHPAAAQMRIPVAGPWLGFSKTKLCADRPEEGKCSEFLVVTGAVLLVLDGIGQAGGVGLMLESIFLPTGPRRAARQTSASLAPLTWQSGNFRVTPVPTVGRNSDLGLSLLGSF